VIWTWPGKRGIVCSPAGLLSRLPLETIRADETGCAASALTGPWFLQGTAMKKIEVVIALLGGLHAFAGLAYAQHADHQMITPADLKWVPIPDMAGAQIAVIEGPMDQPGVPFTARVKFAPNSKVPPHWHSTIEHATVLSGVLNMGLGDKLDTGKTEALGPGSVSIMQAGTHHFAWFGEETVLQLHGIGPWTVTYVNPADAPAR
jgi:quercetin dioxygenase-like cupin family protein